MHSGRLLTRVPACAGLGAGALVGELTDPNLTTICPVNKPHPRLDLIGGCRPAAARAARVVGGGPGRYPDQSGHCLSKPPCCVRGSLQGLPALILLP